MQRHNQPPSGAASLSRRRWPSDLIIRLPQRDPSPQRTTHHQQQQFINLYDLDRLNRIGTGGRVYKVLHRRTGKVYALKYIYCDPKDTVHGQIRRKIQILRDTNNPNVVKCHGMFDHKGEIKVLLEHMDKGSLERAHIPHEPFLSDLTKQILSGLRYLHAQKIVHGNIKPSNFLKNSRGVVKIADFEVPRSLVQALDTSTGISYLCPERINVELNNCKYCGYAGDIWSLGVSILELFVGKLAFGVDGEGDWGSLMHAICMSEPPEASPTASREFRDFIACCLQRDPSRRSTAAQLLQHPFIVMYSQTS